MLAVAKGTLDTNANVSQRLYGTQNTLSVVEGAAGSKTDGVGLRYYKAHLAGSAVQQLLLKIHAFVGAHRCDHAVGVLQHSGKQGITISCKDRSKPHPPSGDQPCGASHMARHIWLTDTLRVSIADLAFKVCADPH